MTTCMECGQHIDCETTLKYYEEELDKKAERIATLLAEIEVLQKKVMRYEIKNRVRTEEVIINFGKGR